MVPPPPQEQLFLSSLLLFTKIEVSMGVAASNFKKQKFSMTVNYTCRYPKFYKHVLKLNGKVRNLGYLY